MTILFYFAKSYELVLGVYFDICFCKESFSWLIFKNIMKSPLSSSKNHIFYIVLHSHLKSYIYI
jgi:hypothetical protein